MHEIHKACRDGNLEMVRSLIDRKDKLVNLREYRGWTPLFYACATNSVEIACFLITKGACVDAKDKYGETPLHRTVSEKCGRIRKNSVSCSLVKMLLDSGADPEIKDKNGRDPLWIIWKWSSPVESWQWGIVQLLLKYGADILGKIEVSIYICVTPFVLSFAHKFLACK